MGAEVVRLLNLRPGAVVVDGTVGTGGHSLMILPRLLPAGRLIGVDRDAESLEVAKRRLAEFESQATFVHGNFRDLPALLTRLQHSQIDGLLLDLGMSSLHVDSADRGFSFAKDGPLDMRMDRHQDATAATLVNQLSADDLEVILATLGEERFAARIARRIVEVRRRAPITTTAQLARFVVEAIPQAARHGRLHVATRTFQALRMAVNDELAALQAFLEALPGLLSPRGRAVVLTFHSLEDRLIKQAFRQGAREGRWTVLTKKPVRPSADEVARNPRARSAKLRAIEQP